MIICLYATRKDLRLFCKAMPIFYVINSTHLNTPPYQEPLITMKFYLRIIFICLCLTTPAQAGTWPKLEDPTEVKECTEALKIAQHVFLSDAFYLYSSTANWPKDIESTQVLGPSALDISGGDGIKADEKVFLRAPDENRFVYWQTQPKSPYRLALREASYGWRGDQYALYALPENVTIESFLKSSQKYAPKNQFSPLVASNWRPPLVMQRMDGSLWVTEMSEPYIHFVEWSIYTSPTEGNMDAQCKIQFGPKGMEAVSLLPRSVQKFAALLDATLGTGENEGTLRPTSRIRVNVLHTWANAALRPWALSPDLPYNSRKEVDQHLLKWARPVKSFYKLYQDIYTLYPTAQKAMEEYYISFGKTPTKAKKLAAMALDVAFRSYFLFPKGSPEN